MPARGSARVRCGEQEDVVGEASLACGPDLLARVMTRTPSPSSSARVFQAGEVGAGLGLGETLAPRDLARGIFGRTPSSAPRSPPRIVGPTRVSPKKSARSGAPGSGELLVRDHPPWWRERGPPPYSLGPGRADPAAAVSFSVPLAEAQVPVRTAGLARSPRPNQPSGRVLLEPGTDLDAEGLLGLRAGTGPCPHLDPSLADRSSGGHRTSRGGRASGGVRGGARWALRRLGVGHAWLEISLAVGEWPAVAGERASAAGPPPSSLGGGTPTFTEGLGELGPAPAAHDGEAAHEVDGARSASPGGR